MPRGLSRRALLLGAAAAGTVLVAPAITAPQASAASGATTSRTQTVSAFPRAREVGDGRTYQALSASDLNPTGFYLAPDVALEVTVSQATAEEHILVVGAPDAEIDEAKRAVREYPLKKGKVTVTDPFGGPIYWKVIGHRGYLRATLGSAAARMPFFIHGTTTESEFQDQLDARDTPYAELVSSHALVTVQIEAARRFRGEDHARLMSTFEEIIGIEDALAGLDDTSALHARLDHRYHFVTRAAGIEGVGAFATHGHMLFPAPIQDRLLTVDALRLRGWGVYHELGHQHQQTVYKPSALTESTVNWYSLAVNRKFGTLYGQAPRLHVPESTGETVWSSAVPKIGIEGVDFLTTFTIMEQLVMYEQLRLAYGDALFRDVHRLVREEKPEPGDYDDNDYRLGMLVYYLSKAAGADLREYAAAWGIRYRPSIAEDIAALALPQPEQDLTAIRDEDGAALAAQVLASPTLRRANGLG
ncbi:M60 family metallopeptidase [Brachybacterium hainanense]|uniref:M60 family metallopeptidase n=2 Tax=Brachybacterium hainanense TaxID=1541174 RepID=A0ABV6R5Y4_9MICO